MNGLRRGVNPARMNCDHVQGTEGGEDGAPLAARQARGKGSVNLLYRDPATDLVQRRKRRLPRVRRECRQFSRRAQCGFACAST